MPLPGTWRSLAYAVLLSTSAALTVSCSKDPVHVDRNRPPQTFLVSAPVDTTVDNLAYSYRIHLYWRGEDSDGYVVGFLWAWDDSSISNFQFTTRTDSIFMLTVNDSSLIASGGGTTSVAGTAKAHTFYIRAVDNLGKADPSLIMFNSRTFKAQTERPLVTFTGNLPNLSDSAVIDTLCDGAPFRVTWSAIDPDGIPGAVIRYKVDIGSYTSPITTDTVAYFNDPNEPGAVALASGLYTMTVTAIDVANAIGEAKLQLVVNRDPETWFKPQGAPIGHYIQYFYKGQPTQIEGTFAPGDTVPYRSTVWWEWDGEDSHNGCEGPLPGCINGWSLVVNPGTRNNFEPYIIGYLDSLPPVGPLVPFKTNSPNVLGPLGFTELILDSLDAGYNFVARVSSRDCSGRGDGSAGFGVGAFLFHCDFPPQLTGLTVVDSFTIAEPGGIAEPCKVIFWTTDDFEDGFTKYALVTLDGTLRMRLTGFEQSLVVPERKFRALSPLNPHTIEVQVADRAEIRSGTTLSIQTTVNYP